MSLKERLKESRKKAGKTQAEVAENVNISQPAYQALESGRNQKSAFLPMIAQYLQVDPYWLTTGGDGDNFLEKDLSKPTVVEHGSDNDFVWIDVVEASFSCGAGESIEFHFEAINGKFPFPPSFMKDKGVTDKTMKIIKAKGDSMSDFIKDGDMVGINLNQTDIIDGEVYAFYFAGEGMIKQIFKEADGSLVLHSLNEKYKDKVVTEENGKNFRIIGRQFWRAG